MPFVAEAPELVASQHYILLADALEEYIKVKVSPLQSAFNTITVTRFAVTDNLLVTRIVKRILSLVYLAVTVQVFVLHITRIPATAIDLRLIGMGTYLFCRLEKSFGYQSPDLTPLFAYIMGREQILRIIELRDFCLIVGQYETYVIRKVFVHPVSPSH